MIRPLGDPDDRLVVHDRPGPSGAVAADHVLGVSASTAALAGSDDPSAGRRRLRPRDRVWRPGRARRRPQRSRRRLRCQPAGGRPGDADDGAQRSRPRRRSALGDRFDPVAGERFELIVANPPFVISPSRRYLFRDSGLPVDELCRSIVRAAPGSSRRRRALPAARVVGPRRRRGLARPAGVVVRRHRLRRLRARA